MNYIGISCGGHDNAFAVVDARGKLIFAEATERYLQNKRAIGYPAEDFVRTKKLIETYCDKGADLVIAKSWSDKADSLLAREEAHVRGLDRVVAERARSEQEQGGSAQSSIFDELIYVTKLVRRNTLEAGMAIENHVRGKRRVEVRSYSHHLTHAAAACYSGPKSEAVCAIIDGFGEGTAADFFRFENGKLTPLLEQPRQDGWLGVSLGLFYSYLTGLCGFDIWQGEHWKVMGLAPYGKRNEEIYDIMAQCLRVEGLGFAWPKDERAARRKLATYARKPGAPALEAADLAHTGQAFFADLMTQVLHNLHALGLSDNLVFGGGCALNSSYCGQILARTPFRHLFVFCAPADDGNAVGAAMLAYKQDHPGPHAGTFQPPFLGSTMSPETLANVERFKGGMRVTRHPGEIHEKAAALLAQGKIVGWVQGRAEFGPRALGNRSILADPRPADMKDQINAKVKFREEFRPLAPAILHEHGPAYFVGYQESPYMERTLPFRDEVKAKVPAVVHVDGTGRLQTVKREWNERYYDLIEEFRRLTGIPLVLNTSFNVMGKPIIHSVEDALAVFYTSGLDAMAIDDLLFEKG